MATLYVSSSGDNSDGLTWATAYNTLQTANDALIGVTDDIIILDDEDHNQAGEFDTDTGGKTGGSITVQSRSSDAALCSISGNLTPGSGNYYLFKHDENVVSMTIENITFKDHYRNDGGAIIFWEDQDLTINNCVLNNLTITSTTGAPTGLIRNYHATLPANLTIDGLTVTDCTVSFTGGTGYEGALFSTNKFGGTGTFSNITVDGFTLTGDGNYQLNGMCFHRGTNVWSGINTFKNITITNGHGSYGIIKLESSAGGYLHTIAGTLSIISVNQTLSGANGNNFGYISVSSTDTLTISADVDISGCTSISEPAKTDYGFISSLHASSVLNITGSVTLNGNTASFANGLVSNAGGGGVIFRRITGLNNTCLQGIINITSLGGTSEITGCYLHDNASTNGGGIFCYPASGVNTININNCTVIDNTASGTGNGIVLNELATTTATYTLNNSICRNGGVDEINCAGTGDPAVTITNCNIEGGAAAVTGEDTYTDNIDSADILVGGVPVSGSASIGIGSKWWTGVNPVGANGEPFSDFDTDIGANQSAHSPFHPSNL